MSTHFKPPGKEAMKSKTITSICMLAIIISLYATCYMLFFRTVDVDLTKDIAAKRTIPYIDACRFLGYTDIRTIR